MNVRRENFVTTRILWEMWINLRFVDDKFLLVQSLLYNFILLFVPIHKTWSESELLRRKFEEQLSSYDKADDGVSYHHQKGTDMAIRSGEGNQNIRSHFFPSSQLKMF